MKLFKKTGKTAKELAPTWFIVDYAFCQSAYFLVASTIISKLTEYYNLPLSISNLIVGIPATLGFVEIMGGLFYNNTHNQMRFLRTTNMVWRSLLPIVLLSVMLPGNIAAVCMVVAYVVMSTFQHLSVPGGNDWLVSSTKGYVKSNFFSMRDLTFMIIFTGLSLGMGVLIDNMEAQGNIKFGFQIYGVVVMIFAALSYPFILKILPHPSNEIKREKISILKCLTIPLKDKKYIKVLTFHIVWNFFFIIWCNFLSVYQVRILELDYMTITICATIGSVCRVICIPLFAKFADRFSWKKATLFSLAIMLCCCATWICTNKNTLFLVPVACIFGSTPWAALGIGLFKYQIAYTNEETRSIYFSVNSTLCGITCAISGVVSSVLVGIIEQTDTTPFWIIFAIGMVGVVITMILIGKTPYKEPT